MIQRNPRRSAAQWASIIADYRDSGLSIQSYCEQKCIAAVTFHKWKRRLSSSPPTPSSNQSAFVPVVRSKPNAPAVGSVCVQIGSSITLSISVPGVSDEQ